MPRKAKPNRRIIKPPDVRRSELLEAATRLFARDGFEAVTVSDITVEAGVAKGTFYLYFDSKEELVGALWQRISLAVAERIGELHLPTNCGEWAGYTDRLVRLAIETQVEQHDLHELVRQLPHLAHEGPGHTTRQDPVLERLGDILTAGSAAGAYSVPDPDLYGAVVYRLLHEAGDRATADPASITRVVQATTEMVRRLLLAS